ncbi:MAG: enoyl-ACP reductase [Dehalococcoidia bacterium]|nr:enoyl-ACP reductase [Dehalococcoidia bacterium]
MALLEGKIGLICGVANRHSIAWAVAQAWRDAGAALVFTYQDERHCRNVQELLAGLPHESVLCPCDVTNDADIDATYKVIAEKYGRLDFLLHSVAFAPRKALEGSFIQTSREDFCVTHDVSAYSLVALSRGAVPLMTSGGSMLSISYYGAEKVVPNYNVMGPAKASLEASVRYLACDLGPRNIRINCISAGPVSTLAARGIKGFQDILSQHAACAPLRRNVKAEEVGAAATFLVSDAASAITGQVLYVDCGYNVMGV